MAKGKQGDLTEIATETAQHPPQSKPVEGLHTQAAKDEKPSEKDRAIEVAIEKTNIALYTDYPNMNAQKLNIIRQTVFKDSNFLEACYFLNHAHGVGLDPFKKEVWAWKHKEKIVVTVAEAGYRVNAERHPDYQGIQFGVIYEGDTYSIDIVAGKIEHKRGSMKAGRKPLGAWAIAYRKGVPPIAVDAVFDEYAKPSQYKDSAWDKNPSDMIAKVARARALSIQFPISGVVSEFETVTKDGMTDFVDHHKGEETEEQLAAELLTNKIAEALEVYELYEGDDKEEIGNDIRKAINEKTVTVPFLDNYIEAMSDK